MKIIDANKLNLEALVESIAAHVEKNATATTSSSFEKSPKPSTSVGAQPPRQRSNPFVPPERHLQQGAFGTKQLLDLTPPPLEVSDEARALAQIFDPSMRGIDHLRSRYSIEGHDPQHSYAAYFWECTLRTKKTLQSEPRLDYHLAQLGDFRWSIQHDQKPGSDAKKSGWLRLVPGIAPRVLLTGDNCTALRKAFVSVSNQFGWGISRTPTGDYGDFLGVTDFVEDWKNDRLEKYAGYVRKPEALIMSKARPVGNIWETHTTLANGETIGLSLLYEDSGSSVGPMWVHTHLYGELDIREHLQGLFDDARKEIDPDVSDDDKLKLVSKRIGALHWHLTQTMPFQRGTASINEILAAALYSSHGIDWRGWKEGVLPDVLALCTPNPAQFSEHYVDFLAD